MYDYATFNGAPLERFTVSPYSRNDNDGKRLYYGDLDPSPTGEYVMLPLSSGSDYSGSTVERSNYLVFLEQFPELLIDVYGGHGTYALLCPLAYSCALQDDLNDLEQYPVLDDDAWSNLEYEIESEAWDDWIRGDFVHALEQHEVSIDGLNDTAQHALFQLGYSQSNAEYIHEGGYTSCYVDVERIVLSLIEEGAAS